MPENEDSQMKPTSREVSDTEKALQHDAAGSKSNSLWTYLTTDVDPAKCTPALAAFSFMSGFMSVLLLRQNIFSLGHLTATPYPSLCMRSGSGVVSKLAISFR
jgi:hypothetical protein